jgi:hypothetical protein
MMMLVSAEQAVFKCGQELTNLPKNPELCQKLEIANHTQIDGTKVQNFPNINSVSSPKEGQAQSSPAVQTSPQDMHHRNAQARTILEDERQKLLAQQAELVRNHKLTPSDASREASFQTNLQRIERDLQALSRELARYASSTPNGQVKSMKRDADARN